MATWDERAGLDLDHDRARLACHVQNVVGRRMGHDDVHVAFPDREDQGRPRPLQSGAQVSGALDHDLAGFAGCPRRAWNRCEQGDTRQQKTGDKPPHQLGFGAAGLGPTAFSMR